MSPWNSGGAVTNSAVTLNTFLVNLANVFVMTGPATLDINTRLGRWPDSNRAAVHMPGLASRWTTACWSDSPVLVSHAHFRRVFPTSMTRIIRESLPLNAPQTP